MKKARTILAIVLALVMVLSILPASFADDQKIPEKIERLKSIEDRGKTVAKNGKELKPLDTKVKAIDPETAVPVIVVFDDPALSDLYTAEEIRAKKADAVQARMSDAHDTFFKSLSFEAKRGYDYTALINGMMITTAYKNVASLEKMDGVKRVYLANSYNAPEVQEPNQLNANEMTGASIMQGILYKGEGMVVAVLDTGLNLTHEAFQDYGLITDPAFTQEYVESVETVAPGIYVSAKVPYAYDYYDGDDDVTDYRGHGSHVSGTIAGFAMDADGAVKFSGAAPAAQICFMKIFSDTTGGTNSGIYIAALEDAFLLGVDACNMSLGSPAGFVYDPYVEDELYGNIYKKLDQAGIINCCSAGNEYSMAFNPINFAGNGYVLSDFTDYGILGTPSSYTGNVSVASMENFAYPSVVIEYNGKLISFVDNCSDGEHGWFQNFGGQTLELVDCGKGNPEEIPDDVAGKVALVVRGDLSFSEKNANVAAKGAIGMILYNNEDGRIGMLIDPYYVPAISITQADGLAILEGLEENNTVTVPEGLTEIENPNAWLMSDFSSWGCTPNLQLKPSITAPGGMIYSSVNGASDAYEVYSGTSMASPNACGSFLLLCQYIKDKYPQLSKAQRAELAEDLIESTAYMPYDADDYLYSPRKSGAGLISLGDAISSPVYVAEPIINLYDDPAKTGVFTIEYTLVNLTDSEQVYACMPVVLLDYPASGNYGTYNTLTSLELYEGDGITVEGDTEQVVPANGKFDGKITITLDESVISFLDTSFPNGGFVEGYLAFYSASSQNSGVVAPVNEGVYGDANLDGKVTAADAAEILRAVVDLTELSEEAAFLADVNQDGSVTAADAAFLLRAIVGLEELPALVLEEEVEAPLAHATFLGYYGDWTQAPVLDKLWTNSEDYLYALGYLAVVYPEDFEDGARPYNSFVQYQGNVGLNEVYGGKVQNGLYTYFGANPMTTISSNPDVVYDAYYDTALNYSPLHNAISNEDADSFYVVDWMYSTPMQLRNARHLIMTVSDAETGEIYYVDDTEYLGKAYIDDETGLWTARGSFYWDGVVTNEESELYGEYVPNGTICNVTYETMIDYPGAPLNTEYEFQLIVDNESPIITSVEIDEENKTATVGFVDNGSGVAYVDAYCYDAENNVIDLGYLIGADMETSEDEEDPTLYYTIDLSDVPEGTSFIVLDAMDYATNWPDYTLNLKTGTASMNQYSIGTVQYAVDKIRNDRTWLGTEVPVQGVVTEVYNGVIYVQEMMDNITLDDPGYGMAIELTDSEALADVKVGDVWLFSGELADYYGCPMLKNASLAALLYENEYIEEDSWDPGDELWYIPESIFDLNAILDDPARFVGSVYMLSDLKIIGITEIGDGTRTVSVTNGKACIDIVATYALEEANVGDGVVGAFILTYDLGTPQLRPLCDDSMFWVESY